MGVFLQIQFDTKRTILCVVLIILILGPCGQCCGPGRGRGRRRSPRKLTPLVYKQHVPNVAENTLGASGLIEGRIARDDLRFNELVPNYNPDIFFTDEEGTGADRIMTERCKERLNTLAISVMNHWPGVRLRVMEAWDEGSMHAPNSLHYEGRAVDISTSDKDFSKQGMLARLAVQSGFDWVYYESRSRVHCSVKSESSARKRLGGCFPGTAKVDTPQGSILLKDLREGDLIKVLREDGSFSFSPVLLFLHKDTLGARNFLSVSTSSGRTLHLTPSHLIFIIRQDDEPKKLEVEEVSFTPHLFFKYGVVVLAGSVVPGDYLLVVDSQTQELALEKVVDMTSYRGIGVFAPLTAEGTVVVNDIVTSCYAVIDSQRIAHWAFLPVRLYSKLKNAVWWILSYMGLQQNTQKELEEIKSRILNKLSSTKTIESTDLKISIKSNYSNSHRIRYTKNALNTNKNSVKGEIIRNYKTSNKSSKNNNIINYKLNNIRIYNKKHSMKHNRINDKNINNSTVSEYFSNNSVNSRESEHIHWYPKMLYHIASWILPSHLVYS